jgi:hypothetical protein
VRESAPENMLTHSASHNRLQPAQVQENDMSDESLLPESDGMVVATDTTQSSPAWCTLAFGYHRFFKRF